MATRSSKFLCSLGRCLFAVWVFAIRTAAAEKTHIFIGVGGAWKDLLWVETQRKLHGILYKPILINPHRNVQHLAEKVRGLGGVWYRNAAWTVDDEQLRLHMSPLPIYKGGLDSVLHVRGRHSDSVNVTTVDLARVVHEHAGAADVVVMRMDVEGAEYELLRHLLVKGALCRLARLYLETHAMSNPALNPFRNFDVLLPWLVRPCGTEVFVDSNYHALYESQAMWPKGDGACRRCPALYATLPGAGAAECPSSALPQCFDERFTCRRCCSLRRGPRGDARCWDRAGRAAQARGESARLPSGGVGHEVPEEVLARISSDADKHAWKRDIIEKTLARGSPPIFSYEMCCAGMLGLLMPEFLPLVADREQNEAFSTEDARFYAPVGAPAAPNPPGASPEEGSTEDARFHAPVAALAAPNPPGASPGEGSTEDARFHAPVGPPDAPAAPNPPGASPGEGPAVPAEPRCADFAGVYADSGGGRVTVSQSGCQPTASNDLQQWRVTGVAEGDRIKLWHLVGELRNLGGEGTVVEWGSVRWWLLRPE